MSNPVYVMTVYVVLSHTLSATILALCSRFAVHAVSLVGLLPKKSQNMDHGKPGLQQYSNALTSKLRQQAPAYDMP